MIHSQISQNLTIDFNTCFVQSAHQLRIGHSFQTGSGIDTLNPQSTEVSLLVLTVTESVGQTFLPSILGNSPYILSCTEITSG